MGKESVHAYFYHKSDGGYLVSVSIFAYKLGYKLSNIADAMEAEADEQIVIPTVGNSSAIEESPLSRNDNCLFCKPLTMLSLPLTALAFTA